MNTKRIIYGIFIIVIGLLFWLGNRGLIDFTFKKDWPILLILYGSYFIIKEIFYRIERKNNRINRILKDLESGKITPEEAAEKIKKER